MSQAKAGIRAKALRPIGGGVLGQLRKGKGSWTGVVEVCKVSRYKACVAQYCGHQPHTSLYI